MAPAAGLGKSDGPGTYRRMLNQAYDGSGRVSSAVTAVAVHDHEWVVVHPPAAETRGPSENSTASTEGSTVYGDGSESDGTEMSAIGDDGNWVHPTMASIDNGAEADGTEVKTIDNGENSTAATVATAGLRIMDATTALFLLAE